MTNGILPFAPYQGILLKPLRNHESLYKKNPAYGQHSALLYVCDQGVPIQYHQSEQIPWVVSIPYVHAYRVKNGIKKIKKGQERSIRSKMVNMVKTRQKPLKIRSKQVKNGHKR